MAKKNLSTIAGIALLAAAGAAGTAGWLMSSPSVSSTTEPVANTELTTITEGRDYMVIEKVRGVPADSVVELFWYGCPHCYSLEQFMASEKTDLSQKNWQINKFHVPSKDGFIGFDFNIWVSLRQMGLDETVGREYMQALHEDGLDRKNAAKFLESKGVSIETLDKLKDSDEAKNIFAFVSKFTASGEVSGVPAIIVGGRYLVNPTADFPKVVDHLLSMKKAE